MSYSSSRRPVNRNRGTLARVLFIVITFLGVGTFLVLPYTNSHTQTCTVESKDRVSGYKGKSDMRVYTKDCGVLSVKDMLGSWNSADKYSQIEDGQTYKITTTGYRVGILSMFPVVRDIAPVNN